MGQHERLESLLRRYVEHEILQGEALDPVEICRDSPELLQPLREHIEEYERLQGDLKQIGESSVATGVGTRPGAPEAGALPLGQVLGERYQIRELLGQGAVGQVWRAFDLKLQVEVALKAIRIEAGAGTEATELLRREVRVARARSSPRTSAGSSTFRRSASSS